MVGAVVTFDVKTDGTMVVLFVNNVLGTNVTGGTLVIELVGAVVVVTTAGDVVVDEIVGTSGVAVSEVGKSILKKSLIGAVTGVITSSAWTKAIMGTSHT